LKKIVKQKTHAGVRASRARETNRRLSMLDDSFAVFSRHSHRQLHVCVKAA